MTADDSASLIPDSHRDLAEHAAVAILSTLGPDGFPQSTAVGYWLDGGVFRITVSDDRQKLKNLRRRPECTIFLLDLANTYRTVEVRGRAELIPDDDFVWAAKIAECRGGTVEDVRRVTPPGAHRFCIAVRPVKVNTYGSIS
jgi:PPOX class probable F420-dependent enzyme